MTTVSSDLDELFKECISAVNCYGRCLLKDPSDSDPSDFQELSQCMMVFCDARSRCLATDKFYSDYSHKMKADDFEIDGIVERIRADYEENILELPLGEKNEMYLKFKKSFLPRNNSLDDSEIAAISQVISTIDPITRLTMRDPVKNIKCGHVYEKSSILILIKQKGRVRCPIAGCNATDFVNEDDLIPDVVLKRYLNQNQQS